MKLLAIKNHKEAEDFPVAIISFGILWAGEGDRFRGLYFKYESPFIKYLDYTDEYPYRFDKRKIYYRYITIVRISKVLFAWKNLRITISKFKIRTEE